MRGADERLEQTPNRTEAAERERPFRRPWHPSIRHTPAIFICSGEPKARGGFLRDSHQIDCNWLSLLRSPAAEARAFPLLFREGSGGGSAATR